MKLAQPIRVSEGVFEMTSLKCLPITTLWFLVLLVPGGGGAAVELIDVKVPEYKERGSSASLRCHYRLGGNTQLYSLKWYKEGRQFFQHIPGNAEPVSVFKVAGINVNLDRSDGKTVVLDGLQLNSSGNFRCEIITEGPKFVTSVGEGNLTVIDLPESAPVLEGARTSYRLGDRVDVNCTSPLSKPAAALKWYINEELAPSSWLRPFPTQLEPEGLETARLGLRFMTSRKHFPKGQLRLKCVAEIGEIYLQSQETSVIETSFLHQTQAEQSTSADSRFIFGSGSRAALSHPTVAVLTLFGYIWARIST
ncbi:uncharacterized protein LOC143040593 [Oratosquilla oratoria]|uniref:uncharacterized protein LOC143040593 n=1 Tax=Oratosquilla oratoria TaxID=337810 RepID=UPI003F75DA31